MRVKYGVRKLLKLMVLNYTNPQQKYNWSGTENIRGKKQALMEIPYNFTNAFRAHYSPFPFCCKMINWFSPMLLILKLGREYGEISSYFLLLYVHKTMIICFVKKKVMVFNSGWQLYENWWTPTSRNFKEVKKNWSYCCIAVQYTSISQSSFKNHGLSALLSLSYSVR